MVSSISASTARRPRERTRGDGRVFHAQAGERAVDVEISGMDEGELHKAPERKSCR